MKVYNITSNKGNKIANQFTIHDDYNNKFFQSYNSIIIKIENYFDNSKPNKTYLDKNYWDYSVTTMKHLYNFLRQWGYDLNKKKVLELIEDGVFTITNLNKV